PGGSSCTRRPRSHRDDLPPARSLPRGAVAATAPNERFSHVAAQTPRESLCRLFPPAATTLETLRAPSAQIASQHSSVKPAPLSRLNLSDARFECWQQ